MVLDSGKVCVRSAGILLLSPTRLRNNSRRCRRPCLLLRLVGKSNASSWLYLVVSCVAQLCKGIRALTVSLLQECGLGAAVLTLGGGCVVLFPFSMRASLVEFELASRVLDAAVAL
jgi:hypothetical protein